MSTFAAVFITGHTTSSTPHPHILYTLRVTLQDGSQHQILRRYSEFVDLQISLRDPFTLPAKHSFTTNFVPLAWVNNELISERKKGLAMYMRNLIKSSEFGDHPVLVRFLTQDSSAPSATPPICGDDLVAQIEYKSSAEPVSARTGPDQDEPHKEPIAAAYYPSWAGNTLRPSDIDFSKFDIIFFAFVTPNGVAGINWDDGSQTLLQGLVSGARSVPSSTRIVLSIGGWGGCYWFSHALSNASNRTKLCDALTQAVNKFGLDGIDIDWEYPNDPGPGNPHSPSDSTNLLSFIKLLRSSLGPTRIISSAVTHMPWKGADGKPLKNVSEFAQYMNFVNIMNYDVFGASEKPGPNAPLGNRCGTSSQPEATARAALAQWTNAGMPASKLLLGMPLYGYVSRSSATRLSGSFAPVPGDPIFPPGAHPRRQIRTPEETTAPTGDVSRLWGQQIAFNQLLSFGVLVKELDGTYAGINGYTMGWDRCSDTPYLFNQARTTVITYDDTWSLTGKAKFAKESGMAGCFTWSLDQDDGITLHNVIRAGLGKKQ